MVAECRKVFSVPGTAGSASSSHISRSVLASGYVPGVFDARYSFVFLHEDHLPVACELRDDSVACSMLDIHA